MMVLMCASKERETDEVETIILNGKWEVERSAFLIGKKWIELIFLDINFWEGDVKTESC